MSLTVRGPAVAEGDRVLTPAALEFVELLARRFDGTRRELLARRTARQTAIREGARPDFLAETKRIRESDWSVALAPDDLQDRRVEITGPVDRKMVINALNCGARVFMADFEDSNAPTWENCVAGQANLQDAIRRTISLSVADGRTYKLNDRVATLLVRPRGWHLTEKHLLADGAPVSASLVDFGLYVFHNARELMARGSGPYFYLPKMESHLEARLWNDVFIAAQDALGIPRGTIRATVLIETILAAFEMEEILYELREHSSGLNAGRWDYIFSAIKKFAHRPDAVLPDRVQVTMTAPFMRAYTELLVKTCHRRGAHAIGGMAAFIPNRRDPVVNERAMAAVRADKQREAGDGFDGTWVAHPDLVAVALEAFDAKLGSRPHQKDRQRDDVTADAARLLDFRVPDGLITEAGVRNDITVAIQYIESWLRGTGAVALFNLMEDAATAEIARGQLWQWRRHAATLDDGRPVTRELYETLRDEELAKLERVEGNRIAEATAMVDRLVLADTFEEFLTLRAYELVP
ncbi:MAG TPA: malate synthase A [Candidatus Binatia bacterium]|jgi:malate synthase|nr:malate synthase A [Candidatus Binatia bacterium]